MRCYFLTLGTLFSAAALFAQVNVAQQNIAPKQAMDGAVRRALAFPTLPATSNRTFFRVPEPKAVLMAGPGVCAIPLLEARGTAAHDPIAFAPRPGIDPKMAVAPRVPACPSGAVSITRP